MEGASSSQSSPTIHGFQCEVDPSSRGEGWATPKKTVLVRAFKPMGYDRQAERGTFTLRRRTPGHLTVEIRLDVGT